MASQRRQQREDFFRDLYALDEFTDADEDPNESATSPLNASTIARVSKRRRGYVDQRSRVVSFGKHTADTVADSGRESCHAPEPTLHTTLPVLRRAHSDKDSRVRVARRTAEVKTKSISDLISDDKRIFKGMCFYFIPTRDTRHLRQQQMNKAIALGASYTSTWTNSVTHIIADSKWSLDQVIKELPEGGKAPGVLLVTDVWLVEGFLQNFVPDPDQRRFLVKGMTSPFNIPNELPTGHTVPRQEAANVTFPARRREAVMTQEKTTFGNKQQASQLKPPPPGAFIATSSKSDELDNLQAEMHNVNLDLVEDIVASDPSFKFEGDYVLDPVDISVQRPSFSCMNKHERGNSERNPNSLTIQLLQQMAKVYELNSNDQWRARAFRGAATVLSKQRVLVLSKAQAAALPGIGESIAQKIEEIAWTGRLGRLEETNSNPFYRTLNLFMGIYQVGHPQAAVWAAQGYTTLDDLLENAKLTKNQRIGIEHYEDFQTRIPRAEVTKHGQIVEAALKAIDPDLMLIIGGSYRRGCPDSGDIDIMISKKGAGMAYLQTAILETLVPQLRKQGFVVGELVGGRSYAKEQSSKWMGACCLPGMKIWRRLDILFVPWTEMGAALIYWTGNDFFNRSMRLLASRKGMRLNQHGLYGNVVRGKGGKRDTEGQLLASHSEKEIFDILGVTYRPPEHRMP